MLGNARPRARYADSLTYYSFFVFLHIFMSKGTNHNSLTLLRRCFAAMMMVAVLLQMSMVSVTYATCSSEGTERIALGELKSCCVHPALDFSALSQKCCEIEKSEAVFFKFKDSHEELISFGELIDATPFALSADALVTSALPHLPPHPEIRPRTGQYLLLRDCRLNV